MIPVEAITAWRACKPWRDDRQVAQDLLLSALAIEIASDPLTGPSLVWRGGTCLHQLHLAAPARYSEDLDYVLLAGTARYRDLDAAFARIAGRLDVSLRGDPVHEPTRYRAFVRAAVAGLAPVELEVEINSADAAPALDLVAPRLAVDVPAWYEGEAAVTTYQAPELAGTKFRALSQRRKGRDLWDLDLARSELRIADGELAVAAAHYLRHERISPTQFRARLASHVTTSEFLTDLDPLLVAGLGSYDAAEVARRVIVWSDAWLDPLLPTHEQRRSRTEASDGLVRCPEYAAHDGSLTRCDQLVAPGAACPSHPDLAAVAAW